MRTTRSSEVGIVDDLSKLGIRAWLMGDRVRVFPKPLVTDSVRQMIGENRAALVKELTKIEADLPKPYFHRCGDLVIPFNSPKRYHWWAGGQSVSETIKEIRGSGGADGNVETN
jgi:hypothetical protein